jgi:hypothetical protein
LLVAGGLAFVIDSTALEGILEVSPILLLVWAAAIDIKAARQTRPSISAPARQTLA